MAGSSGEADPGSGLSGAGGVAGSSGEADPGSGLSGAGGVAGSSGEADPALASQVQVVWRAPYK